MPHTCLRHTDRSVEWEIRNGRHPEVVREIARITGYYSEWLIVPDKQWRRRPLTHDILEETGAKLVLNVNPWFMRHEDGKPVFSRPENVAAWQHQIRRLRVQIGAWIHEADVTPAWVNVNDETFFLKDVDAELVLRRTVELWLAIRDFFPDAALHWYDCRMIRDGELYPKLHPCTPGPCGCNLYWEDAFRNARNVGNTTRLARTLTLDWVAWVQLHSLKRGSKWILPPGAHWYDTAATIIRKAGASAVDEDGQENEWKDEDDA
jgi:hypothetical protein